MVEQCSKQFILSWLREGELFFFFSIYKIYGTNLLWGSAPRESICNLFSELTG